jgi:hypothetical protein
MASSNLLLKNDFIKNSPNIFIVTYPQLKVAKAALHLSFNVVAGISVARDCADNEIHSATVRTVTLRADLFRGSF